MMLVINSCVALVITLRRYWFNEEEVAVMWNRLVDLRRFQWPPF
jgi:hypothetical protein